MSTRSLRKQRRSNDFPSPAARRAVRSSLAFPPKNPYCIAVIVKPFNNPPVESKQSLYISATDLRKECEGFVLSMTEKRAETRGTYERALRQFLRWRQKDRAFRFRSADVERFKRYLGERRKLSDVSVSTYLTAVRRFCQFLVDTGILKENPARFVGGNKRPTTHSRAALSPAEVEKLLSSVDPSTPRGMRDYAMIKTMLGCGLSEIEMIRADIGDLQGENGQEIIRVQGKGHASKDEAAPVPNDVKSAIDRYLSTRDPVSPGQPLFLSAGNKVHGKRMTTRGIRERVNYYLKRAGIKSAHQVGSHKVGGQARRVTPYSLRHTAALMMVEAGVTAEELRQRMRLGSMATAMIYVNQRRTG